MLMWCENKNSAQKWCINYVVLEGLLGYGIGLEMAWILAL